MISGDMIALLLVFGLGWVTSYYFHSPTEETLAKIKGMDERESKLSELEQSLKSQKEALNSRSANIEALVWEVNERKKNADKEISKYQNIALKARQELAGARARFKRKLKTKGERGV